jgi:hypothetical protein
MTDTTLPFDEIAKAVQGRRSGYGAISGLQLDRAGGTIDVATEPGNFTEFIVVLPRANGVQNKSRGRA